MKIALAHDSLTQYGGAERVLEGLHELYPDAPVFTLVYDHKLAGHFEDWQIISSPLQYLYNIFPRLQYYMPLIPFALRAFDFSGYDVVLSSSSIFMKNIRVPKGVLHINYCHTPARFIWINMASYIDQEVPILLRPFKFLLKMYLAWARRWDYNAAQRPDFFIANSENTKQRIRKYYNRDSEVIYPFVDLETFYPSKPKEKYFLLAGRLHKHKKAEIVIEAFNKLKKELHVVGTGRAEDQLKGIAGDNISFLGSVPNEILRNEYSGAQALVFPQEEDFGIVPLEAFACGTPVIAYARGGALESVTPQTGVFFEQQTVAAVAQAVLDFNADMFMSEHLFDRAEQFSKAVFQERITKFVESCLQQVAQEQVGQEQVNGKGMHREEHHARSN